VSISIPSNLLQDYISRDELAHQLRCNARTLIRWEEQRTGPPVTRIGKRVFYHVPSVQLWLAACQREMIRARGRKSNAR
jgi:hypothetical protein